MRPYLSATLGLFLLASVGCSSSSSTGSVSSARPESCTTATDCSSGEVCISQNGSDFYCSTLCTSDSQCPPQQQCAGATGSADAKCGNMGTYANGSGACSLFNGPYGPNTCDGSDTTGGTSSGGAAASSGGAPGSAGASSTVQAGWADAATCSTGAQNFYECCLLSGSSCSTLDQYTSCCETKSCAAGGILACMASHHETDPTSCSSALTTCGD